ncbi:MAG: hypothetical protein ACREA5_02190 [Nitrosotalea sp.]
MTAISTIERTETTKCHTCDCGCTKLCTRCGKNFCARHMLGHIENRSGYKTIIHNILREDDLAEIVKQIMETMLKTI